VASHGQHFAIPGWYLLKYQDDRSLASAIPWLGPTWNLDRETRSHVPNMKHFGTIGMPSDSRLQDAGVGESVFIKLESSPLITFCQALRNKDAAKTQWSRVRRQAHSRPYHAVGEHESLQHDRAWESCTAYVQACRNIYGVFLRRIGVVRRLKRQRHPSFVHFRCITTLVDTRYSVFRT
jgi:hypothetical protein